FNGEVKYTFDFQAMSRNCSCCTETKKSRQQVWLLCKNGSILPYQLKTHWELTHPVCDTSGVLVQPSRKRRNHGSPL
uniref:Uncharacterized protein n=1 Tax=Leptobrachium leishanense TaxID=445787 RepID=A0A8C5MKM9_9ANUR